MFLVSACGICVRAVQTRCARLCPVGHSAVGSERPSDFGGVGQGYVDVVVVQGIAGPSTVTTVSVPLTVIVPAP